MFKWGRSAPVAKASDVAPFLTLGLFQLENLSMQRVPYLLIDLTKEALASAPKVIQEATRLQPQDVKNYLQEKAIDVDLPVIFICEDGQQSEKLARELAQKTSITNYFVFEGGYKAILDVPF